MSKKASLSVIVLFIIIVVAILVLNRWIQGKVMKLEQRPIKKAVVKKTVTPKQPVTKVKPSTNEIIKRTRVLPGTEYVEHYFYQGDVEIARQRFSATGLVEERGTVPDGKLKFFDSYKKTHGEETYRYGKRHGVATTYYENEQLKSRAYYRDGRLLTNQEYYNSGSLRFEVDYQEARDYPGDKEVGIGKLYFMNGNIKYEWNMTITQPKGYKKSYSRDGRLRHVDYFDEQGNLIEE